nr:ribonuclease H-like domain-containing protein [Tanacetum cinerariifolium]
TQANDDQGANSEEIDLNEEHFVLPIWSAYSTTVKSSRDKIEKNTGFKTSESLRKEATYDIKNASTSSSNLINTACTPLSIVGPSRAFNDGELSYLDPSKYALPDDPSMPHLEDIYASTSEGIFTDSSYDDEGEKGKQHKASCKAKTVSFVNRPLQILHMDLIRPTSVKSINHKTYYLVIIDGFRRTPQQNRVSERKNKTLIEAARTMLADSFLPTIFWAEVVNTACYVLNRVLVTKPQNKTPYEILTVENQANKSAGPKEVNNSAGTQANDDQGANSEEIDLNEEHFVLPIWSAYSTTVKSSRDKIEKNTGFKTCEKLVSQVEQVFLEKLEKLKRQEKEASDAAESLRKEATHDIKNASTSSSNLINNASTPLSTADDPSMPHLEDIYASTSEGIFTDSSYDDEGEDSDNEQYLGTVWAGILFQEAAKFVGDFKSLTNEADASLAEHKALELEIKRLLKEVVSKDIMIIVQNESVVDTSDL